MNEPIDVVEALSVLMDVIELADSPETQAELDDILGVVVRLIPDYLAVYPDKKNDVLAVLNRKHGAPVSSLDTALAWYSKLPAAPIPKWPKPQSVPADPVAPVSDSPPQRVRPEQPKSPQASGPPPSPPPGSRVGKPAALLDRFKHWLSSKPEAPSLVISDADEKRAALLKKLEAIRDGQNPFS